jgi:hypothetical protein
MNYPGQQLLKRVDITVGGDDYPKWYCIKCNGFKSDHKLDIRNEITAIVQNYVIPDLAKIITNYAYSVPICGNSTRVRVNCGGIVDWDTPINHNRDLCSEKFQWDWFTKNTSNNPCPKYWDKDGGYDIKYKPCPSQKYVLEKHDPVVVESFNNDMLDFYSNFTVPASKRRGYNNMIGI